MVKFCADAAPRPTKVVANPLFVSNLRWWTLMPRRRQHQTIQTKAPRPPPLPQTHTPSQSWTAQHLRPRHPVAAIMQRRPLGPPAKLRCNHLHPLNVHPLNARLKPLQSPMARNTSSILRTSWRMALNSSESLLPGLPGAARGAILMVIASRPQATVSVACRKSMVFVKRSQSARVPPPSYVSLTSGIEPKKSCMLSRSVAVPFASSVRSLTSL